MRKYIWKDNIKIAFRMIGYEGVDWIELGEVMSKMELLLT